MHYFDIVAIAVLGVFGTLGIKKGLVDELFKFIGIIFAILIAIQYVEAGANFLAKYVEAEPDKLGLVSFILIVIVTMVVFRILAKIIKGIMKFAMMGWVDRLGGGVFGAAKGALILSGLIWIVMFLPTNKYTENLEKESSTYPFIRGFAPKIYNSVFNAIPGSDTFMDKIQDFIPVGNPGESLQKFQNPDIMKQIREQLGGELDVGNLDDLNADKIRELMENPEMRKKINQSLPEEQQQAIDELLEKGTTSSGDKLPGIP